MHLYDEGLGIGYEIKDDNGIKTVTITDADKKITEIDIPDTVGGCVVDAIGKKAFLGCKGLRRVSLPDGVRSIGEWAFAFCDNLAFVELSRGPVELGKGVFKNDGSLKEIMLRTDEREGMSEAESKMTAHLLAAIPVLMDAEYLLDTNGAGDAEWLKKWDTKLSHILSLKDDDGYHLYVLCGEEDLHYDYDQYLEYNREKRSDLCMLRLVNDIGLSDEDRPVLEKYVNDHMCGCVSEAAARVLTGRHGDEKEYYEMMLKIGAINTGNLESMLAMLGDRHAQMKAFLMEELGSRGGFFDDLEI
ncbi:MAG: leucine-rich repeat domain-containing protein [Lachnospiraceae bacterium]|nr:leucine-rich repeat domain-containing protein [Lachnospiraceae bacterium]